MRSPSRGSMKLGIDPQDPASGYDGFGLEFRQGATDPDRSRFLGDFGDNDPDRWAWGGRHGEKSQDQHPLPVPDVCQAFSERCAPEAD